MESEDRYDEFINILIKDQTLPDVLVISDRDMLKELVENDLVEDLTDQRNVRKLWKRSSGVCEI